MLNNYTEIYHVEDLPVFQNRMFLSEEAALNCLKGNLVLVQDIETGLIFNKEFQSQLMQYDECYQNEQAVSSIFKDHLLSVSKIIARHFRNMSLIELGCGKGYFLEQLQDQGFDITGFDPAYEGKNPKIIKKYFDPDVGMNAEGIILRHVLEHVQNPVKFMTDICQSNEGKGKIYIEVPCFDWICRKRAWFDIFYEHVNYFRMSDFIRMFDKIFEMGHVFGGQYLYVIAELATIKKPVYTNLYSIEFPKNFLDTIYGYVNRIKSQVSSLRSRKSFCNMGGCIKRGDFWIIHEACRC